MLNHQLVTNNIYVDFKNTRVGRDGYTGEVT